MESLICGLRKMVTSPSICCVHVSDKLVLLGKKKEEQKEEWQLTPDSGTNLHEPACSRLQQQAIKNRSRYFLAIKVACD